MLCAVSANVPGVQGIARTLSVEGQAWPGGHTVQFVLRASAIVPALHGTGRPVVLAHADPAGQTVQLVCPPSEYVPAVHATGGNAVDGHDQPAAQRIQRVRVFTCGVCVV